MTRFAISTLILILTLAFAESALSATDAEKCQKDLSSASAKYGSCVAKALGGFYGGGESSKLEIDAGKCARSYALTWIKLVGKYAGKGTSCEGDRWLENGDGTVYDRLTRLTWEMKDDAGGIHDKDNVYDWSDGLPIKEDGTAYTTFLETLNDEGFGGSSGWRVPSILELNSLVEPSYPDCTSAPCTTIPGETAPNLYWSSSKIPDPSVLLWGIDFADGSVFRGNDSNAGAVRAVRGGS